MTNSVMRFYDWGDSYKQTLMTPSKRGNNEHEPRVWSHWVHLCDELKSVMKDLANDLEEAGLDSTPCWICSSNATSFEVDELELDKVWTLVKRLEIQNPDLAGGVVAGAYDPKSAGEDEEDQVHGNAKAPPTDGDAITLLLQSAAESRRQLGEQKFKTKAALSRAASPPGKSLSTSGKAFVAFWDKYSKEPSKTGFHPRTETSSNYDGIGEDDEGLRRAMDCAGEDDDDNW